MGKKESQRRSARKARAARRAELEEARAASSNAPAAAGAKNSSRLAKSEAKTPAKSSKDDKPAKKPGRLRSYLRDVKTEMHRVVWPGRKELQNYSVAVIIAIIVFGVCVGLVDTGFVALLAAFTSLGV